MVLYISTITNPTAKRVLVYGDSVTWGVVPLEFKRFPSDKRFTGILQASLGDDYEIIEEGLGYRKAKGENPLMENCDGYKTFPAILSTHLPIDILVIYLGKNDLAKEANKSAQQITDDLESYIPLLNSLLDTWENELDIHRPEKVMYVSPVKIIPAIFDIPGYFDGAEEKSNQIPQLIKEMAVRNGVEFFDANSVTEACKEDGVHLDEQGNRNLGEGLARFIRDLN